MTKKKKRRKGTAKELIRFLHRKYPRMTNKDLALSVVCSESYVSKVLGRKRK